MKKVGFIFILICIIIFVSSCEFGNIDTGEKIIPPKNNLSPIYGQWRIKKFKSGNVNAMNEDDARKYLNKTAIFNDKIAAIGDDFCLEPSYKIKNVNAADYLWYQYKISPDYLGIKDKNIQIMTITSEDQFFYEFIMLSDKEILTDINGMLFYLKKESNVVEDEKINEYITKEDGLIGESDLDNDEVFRSGIVLGLRYLDKTKDDEYDQWQYRTIWISSKDRNIDKIYEVENLFVPRKSGFWKIEVKREKKNGNQKDIIYSYPFDKETMVEGENLLESESSSTGKKVVLKSILYVGNDYISTERIDKAPKNTSKLQVFPVDNIEKGIPVKISDLAGENGKNALNEGFSKNLLNNVDKSEYMNIQPDEENFGLFRRNGHWIMKGRINFIKDNKSSYSDFDIKTIPPKEMVNYDELCLPWNEIKLKVPEAVDAYTSPNKDMAIIIANNNILVYFINNGELSKEPAKRIKLRDGESVVMSEWATGKYIYKWDEEFLKNKAIDISGK